MERDARNAANYSRQVLERIINVTITLATCNLSFRGHREIIGQSNSGNFLSIIQLLARYDQVLKELLERPQGSVKYLSPAIQNEIIYIIAKRVQCDIQEEINSAQFFPVIMDTTQDISKRDQLSQVNRYVTIQRDENNNAKDILINEAFLGFEETVDTSARELQKVPSVLQQTKILENVNAVSKMLQAKDFDIQKAVGLLENIIRPSLHTNITLTRSRAPLLAAKCPSEFMEMRQRRVKRHFDELCEDDWLSDGESYFRIKKQHHGSIIY
ncbi:hypothetical protein F7725_021412 [Scomber scombrus]|uniref:DUF4371 domain-containing protein n=1 Tax=Scomber scombrus TaxID=13677 RepID=A0AAV1Q2N0_SCOSC